MTVPSQFEVWWVEEPDVGRRPGLVLTRNEAIPVLNAVLVAPLTRTVRGIPTEIRLGPSDGMPVECAATFDNIRPVRRSALTHRITALDAFRRLELCAALAAVADC